MVSTVNGRTPARSTANSAKRAVSKNIETKNIDSKNIESKSQTPEWIRSFGESTSTLEREVQSIIQERPIVLLGGAVALGLASFFLLKKTMPTAIPKSKAGKGRGASPIPDSVPGRFAESLTPTLTHFHEQLNRLPFHGIGAVKDDLSTLVRDEFAQRPWQTLGAAVALGFGIAGVDREQAKRGAIRLIQLLAVKSLDGGFSQNQTQSQPDTNPQGEINELEHDSQQPH